MWTLIVEGGFPMWFLLIFGLATWAAAGAFARRPTPRGLRLVLGLGVTTLFSVAMGIVTDLAAVGHHAPAYRAQHPELGWPEILLQGFAEAMSPGVLGFSMLTIAALLVTWGWFREGEDGHSGPPQH